MKISELSDSDLSRWIAEKLEIKPKEWQLDAPYLKHIAWQYVEKRWEPRDMVHDPAMTVMLLEKLMREPKRDCYLTFDHYGELANQYELEIGVTDAGYAQGLRGFILHGAQLGRAVAEAFALANGWTE